MIDEKTLIETLNEYKSLLSLNVMKETLDCVIKTIETQPKVGEWIPVEKRLPEQSLNSVIGWDTYRERCVFVQYYMNEWILGNHESVNIVAWKPLPKLYEVKRK